MGPSKVERSFVIFLFAFTNTGQYGDVAYRAPAVIPAAQYFAEKKLQ
jgi:hypothetical protein